MLSWITPHLSVQSVEQLTRQRLAELGLTALLLDVDCTLKPYRSEGVPGPVEQWISELRRAGVTLCLVSNGRSGRIGRLAERLDLPFVAQAMKPFPRGCRVAVRRLGLDPAKTAMVGDQLLADVMAGRLAGLFTILVEPIRPEEEPWYTRLKRPLERWFLGSRTPSRPTGEE